VQNKNVKQTDVNETDKEPTHYTYQQGFEINDKKTLNKQKTTPSISKT